MNLKDRIRVSGRGVVGKPTVAVSIGNVVICEELNADYAVMIATALRDEISDIIDEAILERINTPEVEDFLKAVANEAAHQGARWDTYDGKRSRANWAGLVGWLMGKALGDEHNPDDDRTPRTRLLHRIIAIAAACFKWHKEEANHE